VRYPEGYVHNCHVGTTPGSRLLWPEDIRVRRRHVLLGDNRTPRLAVAARAYQSGGWNESVPIMANERCAAQNGGYMVRDSNIGSAMWVRAIRVRGRDRDAGRRAAAGIAGRGGRRQEESLVY
jgi:hypothetical protein